MKDDRIILSEKYGVNTSINMIPISFEELRERIQY